MYIKAKVCFYCNTDEVQRQSPEVVIEDTSNQSDDTSISDVSHAHLTSDDECLYDSGNTCRIYNSHVTTYFECTISKEVAIVLLGLAIDI